MVTNAIMRWFIAWAILVTGLASVLALGFWRPVWDIQFALWCGDKWSYDENGKSK